MKNLKSRLVTLIISAVMAVAVMMIAPALTGAFIQQDTMPAPQEAFAAGIENCCVYDAFCGGPNGPKGYELYGGACSERDRRFNDLR